MSTVDAVRRLVGLQAQSVNAPYLGLWSRLAELSLTDLLADRTVVRSSVLRGTQHLVLGEDYGWLRPLVAPTLARAQRASFGRIMAGVDLAELASVGESLLAGRTLTRPQLRDELARRWPSVAPDPLAWSVQALVPVVHPPPSGTWRRGGTTPFTLATEWLGRPLDTRLDPARLVRRYLTGYGPATVKDVQTWSGVPGLTEVVDGMTDLVRAGDRYDLPGQTYPDPDTPAPVRLLPEFDNLVIAYADRTRLMPDEYRRRICVGSMIHPTVLVDGTVRGTWKLRWAKDSATLTVELFERLSRVDQDEVAAEATRLLELAAPDLDRTLTLR
ncbi:MAG: winged helix DNA-binding domain-containing protein [Actinophytocola sp.]|nr:winged helix DNA-binding domain-containing protein [Actinophytocola sp.]